MKKICIIKVERAYIILINIERGKNNYIADISSSYKITPLFFIPLHSRY